MALIDPYSKKRRPLPLSMPTPAPGSAPGTSGGLPATAITAPAAPPPQIAGLPLSMPRPLVAPATPTAPPPVPAPASPQGGTFNTPAINDRANTILGNRPDLSTVGATALAERDLNIPLSMPRSAQQQDAALAQRMAHNQRLAATQAGGFSRAAATDQDSNAILGRMDTLSQARANNNVMNRPDQAGVTADQARAMGMTPNYSGMLANAGVRPEAISLARGNTGLGGGTGRDPLQGQQLSDADRSQLAIDNDAAKTALTDPSLMRRTALSELSEIEKQQLAGNRTRRESLTGQQAKYRAERQIVNGNRASPVYETFSQWNDRTTREQQPERMQQNALAAQQQENEAARQHETKITKMEGDSRVQAAAQRKSLYGTPSNYKPPEVGKSFNEAPATANQFYITKAQTVYDRAAGDDDLPWDQLTEPQKVLFVIQQAELDGWDMTAERNELRQLQKQPAKAAAR